MRVQRSQSAPLGQMSGMRRKKKTAIGAGNRGVIRHFLLVFYHLASFFCPFYPSFFNDANKKTSFLSRSCFNWCKWLTSFLLAIMLVTEIAGSGGANTVWRLTLFFPLKDTPFRCTCCSPTFVVHIAKSAAYVGSVATADTASSVSDPLLRIS